MSHTYFLDVYEHIDNLHDKFQGLIKHTPFFEDHWKSFVHCEQSRVTELGLKVFTFFFNDVKGIEHG